MATAVVINGSANPLTAEKPGLSHDAPGSLPIEKPAPANGAAPVLDGPNVDATSPYHNPSLTLIDRFVDEPRPLRVGVIGGGLAGISAGVLLPKKVPGIQLTIYEKNADVVCVSDQLIVTFY